APIPSTLSAMPLETSPDKRPLSEFYPDPELRGQVHYAFAHQFLPEYVHGNPHYFFSQLYAASSPTLFLQARWFQVFVRRLDLPPRPPPKATESPGLPWVSDLRMSVQTLAGLPSALVE